jgi:hypothetical protein
MNNRFLKQLAFLIAIIFANANNALGFDLFDKDRNKPETPPAPKVEPKPIPVNPFQNIPKPPPKPPVKMLPQQDFVLKGVSQIGERYIVFLEAPNTKTITVDMEDKIRTSVKNGYPDYHLIRMTERKVKIDYPENAPCRNPNPQKGIKCTNGGKSATLEFVVGNPLAPPPDAVVSKNMPDTTVNPFLAAVNKNKELSEEEQKKRDAALEKRRELYKNFKRQVIKDEDVPEGMRVVRTPFGDRVVPDNR